MHRDRLEQKLEEMRESYGKQLDDDSSIMQDIYELQEVYASIVNKSKHIEFENALKALKNGKQVTRAGWHGKGMFLMYVDFTTNPERTRGLYLDQYRLMPVIYIIVDEHEAHPWNPSQADMFADDWIILGDKPELCIKH